MTLTPPKSGDTSRLRALVTRRIGQHVPSVAREETEPTQPSTPAVAEPPEVDPLLRSLLSVIKKEEAAVRSFRGGSQEETHPRLDFPLVSDIDAEEQLVGEHGLEEDPDRFDEPAPAAQVMPPEQAHTLVPQPHQVEPARRAEAPATAVPETDASPRIETPQATASEDFTIGIRAAAYMPPAPSLPVAASQADDGLEPPPPSPGDYEAADLTAATDSDDREHSAAEVGTSTSVDLEADSVEPPPVQGESPAAVPAAVTAAVPVVLALPTVAVVEESGNHRMPLIQVFAQEPLRLDKPMLFQLLGWATRNHVSDVFLQSGFPAIGERFGRLTRLTNRTLTANELVELFGSFSTSGPSQLLGGIPADFRIDFRESSRADPLQFRVNITSTKSPNLGERGLEWTIRPIPTRIFDLSELNLPPILLEHVFPSTGLVLVTGPTGSGKSTLMASVHKESIKSGKRVVTYEAPIEFDLVSVQGEAGFAAQSEIGIDLNGSWKGFEHGIANALRRKPKVIFVGEARDRESISASITAAQTGHAVYSTCHTNSTVGTIGRMTDQFDPKDRPAVESNLIDAMRCIIHQRLVPSTNGERVALLEVLPFTEKLRRRLVFDPGPGRRKIMHEFLISDGFSLARHARDKFNAGLISDYEYQLIRNETGDGGE